MNAWNAKEHRERLAAMTPEEREAHNKELVRQRNARAKAKMFGPPKWKRADLSKMSPEELAEHKRNGDKRRGAEYRARHGATYREMANERARKYAANNKDEVAARRKARKEAMANHPKPEACEVCGGGGKICYDHCHASGRFRGWLCTKCNVALGMAQDSPDILRKLANYLEGHNAT